MTARRALTLSVVVLVGFAATGPSAAGGQSATGGTAPSSRSLQGAWQQDGRSAMLIATATWVAFFGVDSLPALASYTIDGDRLKLRPSAIGRSSTDQILLDDLAIPPRESGAELVLERLEITQTRATFVVPNGPTLAWRRLE